MTDQVIVLEVLGLPEAQGSMVAFIDKRTHTARLKATNETRLKKWRKRIRGAAEHAMHYHDDLIEGPVKVQAVFAFARPDHHYRTGRFDTLLRPNAPFMPDNRATKDADKLARALLDSLTGVVFGDDSQVCDLRVRKLWAGESVHAPDVPGMRIQIEPAHAIEGVLL